MGKITQKGYSHLHTHNLVIRQRRWLNRMQIVNEQFRKTPQWHEPPCNSTKLRPNILQDRTKPNMVSVKPQYGVSKVVYLNWAAIIVLSVTKYATYWVSSWSRCRLLSSHNGVTWIRISNRKRKEKKTKKIRSYLGTGMNVGSLALCWSRYSVMQHKVFCFF